MSKIDNKLIEEFNKIIEETINDNTKEKIRKKLDDILCFIEDDINYDLISRLRYNLSSYVIDMAEKAVEALISGDEELLKRYLSCEGYGYTGREHRHEVIHGRLFETGAIALRKKIIDAYPELLKNERILDLESQIKSLTEQVIKEQRRANEFWERLR